MEIIQAVLSHVNDHWTALGVTVAAATRVVILLLSFVLDFNRF